MRKVKERFSMKRCHEKMTKGEFRMAKECGRMLATGGELFILEIEWTF
jgi:hypothetical protein